MAPQPFRPMPLVRLPEPFEHPDWIFEVKHDGFGALAHISRRLCELRSPNGHTFKHWSQLCEELAHAVTAHHAIIDGEIAAALCARPVSGVRSPRCRSEGSPPLKVPDP